jgi:hypothetical protein
MECVSYVEEAGIELERQHPSVQIEYKGLLEK